MPSVNETECEECGGDGTICVFVTHWGEAVAGDFVEVECPECEGRGSFEN